MTAPTARVHSPGLRADPPVIDLPVEVPAAPTPRVVEPEAKAKVVEPKVVREPRPVREPKPAREPRPPRPVRERPVRERPVREPRPTPDLKLSTLTGERGWIVLLLLGAAAVAAVRFAPDLPDLIRDVGAVVVSGSLAWGLAVRTGGRQVWAAGLAVVLGIGGVSSSWQPLHAGTAIATGVLAATLAVMSTTPASTFGIAIREVLIATALAWVGALGVVGYEPASRAAVDLDRFGYVVIGLSLAGAFALVYRLGAGLHGLGRRGYMVAGGAVVMLVIALAYSQAIAQWGSHDVITTGHHLRDWTKSTFGAVPHPIVALLGYPALLWGVFMRARRRQGWWVTAFGVAATAPSATRLVSPEVGTRSVVLGAVYSLVVGIVVGYLVIRVEQSFMGTHGRRARRDEEAIAHRPEPGRLRPLH